MDKKNEKYKARLVDEFPYNISAFTRKCLADNGIITVGELIDRWEYLYLVTRDRRDFKAMLKGFGIKGVQIDHVANFCASFSYRLQTNREANLLYQKIGGKYVPVECLTERSLGMSEGIYLVKVDGKRGYIRSVHSLLSLANEVGWFKIGGKPKLDFELIAKMDYYTEGIIDFILENKGKIREMSPSQLASHLAKIMLEVTENARENLKKQENDG